MEAKQNIEDQDWEAIAKSIYNEEPDSVTGEIALSDQGISPVEKEHILETAKQVDRYFDLKKYPAEQAWQKVHSRIHGKSKSRQTKIRSLISNSIFRVAAAVLFAALLLVSGYKVFYNSSASKNMMEISATDQILKSFMLPDGTEVSLNTDTKIKYPKIFTGNTREVSIEGEAFFQVKPNKEKPFIIHAGNAQVKVLGTSFNVNAYPAKKSVEVIVETGKVQVLSKETEPSETNELILTPGEKGTLIFTGNSLLKTTNQNPNFLAWKTRNLIFKATALAEVVENLGKVYKVDIRLADPKLNDLLLTAQFNDYPFDFILKVIETTFELEANEENGQYILKARS
jgi:transmembrane sensor